MFSAHRLPELLKEQLVSLDTGTGSLLVNLSNLGWTDYWPSYWGMGLTAEQLFTTAFQSLA